MTTPISNTKDVIDSREIIARIADLESDEAAALADGTDMDKDDFQELEYLRALAEEASGYASDWQYGATLIRDTHFSNYAQQLAEDIGDIQTDLAHRWPYTCIDWEQAAEELQQDYTSIEFDGVTYWVQ